MTSTPDVAPPTPADFAYKEFYRAMVERDQSWAISEPEARRLAHKYFTPSSGSDAPDCPCNGQCTRTGAVWLSPYRRLNEEARS